MLRNEIEITVAIRLLQLTLLRIGTMLERDLKGTQNERSDKSLLLPFNLKMIVVLILYGQGPQTVGPVSHSTFEKSVGLQKSHSIMAKRSAVVFLSGLCSYVSSGFVKKPCQQAKLRNNSELYNRRSFFLCADNKNWRSLFSSLACSKTLCSHCLTG